MKEVEKPQGLCSRRGDRVGECIPGVFGWFGELWGLSGWCEANAVGLDVMGSPTKKISQ